MLLHVKGCSSIGLSVWISYWATVSSAATLCHIFNDLDDRHFNILGIYDCYLYYTLVTLELPQQVESGIKN